MEGRDELSVLTQSFNTMTEQLADARDATSPIAARSKPAIFISRTFSKNLNTGVLVLTDDFVLRVANAAAAVILQARIDERVGEPLTHWSQAEPSLANFADIVSRNFAQAGADDWQREQELMIGGNARSSSVAPAAWSPTLRADRRVRRHHRGLAGAAVTPRGPKWRDGLHTKSKIR